MNEVTITMEEYKKLLEAQIRIKVFSEFVSSEKYAIERRQCAGLLDFELAETEDD